MRKRSGPFPEGSFPEEPFPERPFPERGRQPVIVPSGKLSMDLPFVGVARTFPCPVPWRVSEKYHSGEWRSQRRLPYCFEDGPRREHRTPGRHTKTGFRTRPRQSLCSNRHEPASVKQNRYSATPDSLAKMSGKQGNRTRPDARAFPPREPSRSPESAKAREPPATGAHRRCRNPLPRTPGRPRGEDPRGSPDSP